MAVFVFWLISFPMEGFLLTNTTPDLLLCFLIPHTISLFLIGRFFQSPLFHKASRTGIACTVVLTIATPFLQQHIEMVLALIGVTGAFLTVRSLTVVKSSNSPLVSTGIGIAAGNSLVLVLSKIPAGETFKFVVIALSILAVFFYSINSIREEAPRKDVLYAPFLYVFYLCGGLMYAAIAPRYAGAAWSQGIELFFYIVTALAGIFLALKRLKALFAVGVALCMVSFALYHIQTAGFINLSMFAVQASFALVDIYLVGLLAKAGRPVRAFGYGFGTMCLALLCGEVLGSHTVQSADYVLAASNIILTTAVLTFYFSAYSRENRSAESAEGMAADRIDNQLGIHRRWYEKRLSSQELLVLDQVLLGKTFKQVALRLGISESSVKTYMKRAYEKTGVTSREGLLAMISGTGAPGLLPQDKIRRRKMDEGQ